MSLHYRLHKEGCNILADRVCEPLQSTSLKKFNSNRNSFPVVKRQTPRKMLRNVKPILTDSILIFPSRTTSLSLEQYRQIPHERSRLLALYRRFLRIKPFVSDVGYIREGYSHLIRLRIGQEFNERRRILLHLPDEDAVDNEQRWINTLEFVNRAARYIPSEEAMNGSGMERNILHNIVRIELEKTGRKNRGLATTKSNYRWVNVLKESVENSKAVKAKGIQKAYQYSSLRQHEANVMRFNESFNLCL